MNHLSHPTNRNCAHHSTPPRVFCVMHTAPTPRSLGERCFLFSGGRGRGWSGVAKLASLPGFKADNDSLSSLFIDDWECCIASMLRRKWAKTTLIESAFLKLLRFESTRVEMIFMFLPLLRVDICGILLLRLQSISPGYFLHIGSFKISFCRILHKRFL